MNWVYCFPEENINKNPNNSITCKFIFLPQRKIQDLFSKACGISTSKFCQWKRDGGCDDEGWFETTYIEFFFEFQELYLEGCEEKFYEESIQTQETSDLYRCCTRNQGPAILPGCWWWHRGT